MRDASTQTRFWAGAAALAMAAAVGFGAFGAHAIRDRVTPDLFAVWETGARYHAYHALGLFAVAWLASRTHDDARRRIDVIGWAMLGGIVVFSGSLYVLAATGIRWLGAITPIGGTAWIAAWCVFAFTVLRSHTRS